MANALYAPVGTILKMAIVIRKMWPVKYTNKMDSALNVWNHTFWQMDNVFSLLWGMTHFVKNIKILFAFNVFLEVSWQITDAKLLT